MTKWIGLLGLVLGVLPGGRAGAEMRELNAMTALTFDYIQGGGFSDDLRVFNLTTTPVTQVGGQDSTYRDPFLGQVGFVGTLSGHESWVRIGVDSSPESPYSGFRTFIANDDDGPWDVCAFAQASVSDWVTLTPGSGTWLEIDFEEILDLKTFGFDVRLNAGQEDTFYISVVPGAVSVVPVPGAALLGTLGLGYAGMKLRRRCA